MQDQNSDKPKKDHLTYQELLEKNLEKTQYQAMPAGASSKQAKAEHFATYKPKDRSPVDSYFKKGDKIGHNFTVMELLGEGASGTVYKVLNSIGGMEALKIAPPDLLGTKESRDSFLRELRAARSLHHDYLIPIHNVETLPENGQVFFTMSFMAGYDLNHHLEKMPAGLPPQKVLKWMSQVAEALSYVHSKGLVHQDIKPANILLDKNGIAHLGDFGLAFKYMTDTLKQRLSRTSKAGGTSYFMSPEQNQAIFFGKTMQITAASDVCSFALTLYTLLTQKMLIGRPAPMSKVLANTNQAAALDEFLGKCWEEDPSDRFPNAVPMLDAFNHILQIKPSPIQQHVDSPSFQPEPPVVEKIPVQPVQPQSRPTLEPERPEHTPYQSAPIPSQHSKPPKKPIAKRLLIWSFGIVAWAAIMTAGYLIIPLINESFQNASPSDPFASDLPLEHEIPDGKEIPVDEFEVITKGDTTFVREKDSKKESITLLDKEWPGDKLETPDSNAILKARAAYKKGDLMALRRSMLDISDPEDMGEQIQMLADLEDKKEIQILDRYHSAKKKNDVTRMKKALNELKEFWPDTPTIVTWEAEISSLNIASGSLSKAMGYYFGTGGTYNLNRAKEHFLEAAKTNDPLAVMWVARCYFSARANFKYDGEKATKLAGNSINGVMKRAKSGDAVAQFLLAECYNTGLGVKYNDQSHIDWLKKSADQGFVGSLVNLGSIYRMGSLTQSLNIDKAKAYNLFKQAAGKGEVRSLYYLAEMNFAGEGTKMNEVLAAKNMLAAAERGYTKAQAEMGKLYDLGIGVSQNFTLAEKWYRKAAVMGDFQAQQSLGNMFFFGYGVTRNNSEAFKWYKKSADQGYSVAESSLAHMYKMGYGTSKDLRKAASLYRSASEKGFEDAYYHYAEMLRNGQGLKVNLSEAFKWYLADARLGRSDSQFRVGVMLLQGEGINVNYKDAMDWFKAAEAQGDLVAQNNIGYMYQNGLGVKKDSDMAARYYYASAKSGERLGQYNIATRYQKGEGVNQNSYEAFRWYQAAADQNLAQAQYQLGLMYLNGEATNKNYSQAVYYMRLAANQSDTAAQNKLIELGEGWTDSGGKGK